MSGIANFQLSWKKISCNISNVRNNDNRYFLESQVFSTSSQPHNMKREKLFTSVTTCVKITIVT